MIYTHTHTHTHRERAFINPQTQINPPQSLPLSPRPHTHTQLTSELPMLKQNKGESTIPMAYQYRGNGQKSISMLPSVFYFFMASNGIGSIYRAYARGDNSLAAFISLTYFAFLLVQCCVLAYHQLPPNQKSFRKGLLRCAIWLLFSAMMFGFAYQLAPFFSLAAGLILYGISAACSALLFYVYIIYDFKNCCSSGCSDEKIKLHQCPYPPPNQILDAKKVEHSVILRVT